ncbi:transposon Ty3-I Gag-Pol polyprotein [Trichonephila inaurata madagascariensis]|uniref:RNA-directed DNA polymerase n=1 Tax=Trichonephila inaurata madagascariensis TaxID=2747483 RepID=A0A8X7CDK5_9ARAC|nr:transposon Ty3-I Gag-Pol polyprotein [Trichonephila inaurata madagascariensis]
MDFIGHHVSASGIRKTTERIQAVLNFNRPSTVKQLRRFLGMLNFYRRFLPNAAKHQAKLNDFLVGIRKSKNKSIDWDEDSIKAFEYCKEQLSKSITLAHPLSNVHLAIIVDASDNAVDGVLLQHICLPPTIDYVAIAKDQDSDTKLISLNNYNLKFDKLLVIGSEYKINCEVSTGQPKSYIHATFRREIFECYHRISHPGIRSSVKSISKKFWSNLRHDVTSWSRVAEMHGWISKFGSPSYIVTDQGTQNFKEAELFYELSKLLGFKHITAYHPQANGLVERWHRTLKAAIMCHSDATWYQSQPTILLGLRTTIHEDLKAPLAVLPIANLSSPPLI